MKLKGRVWKLGENIDTDCIVPGQYLTLFEPGELAKHCLEGLDPEMPSKLNPGDIIVAGRNFGCGSSREHAPIALKGAGIACVIAPSFARIFFRNAINIGLNVLESKEALELVNDGDILEIDLEDGFLTNLATKKTCKVSPMPGFVKEIMEAGGLTNYVRQRQIGNA